MTFLYQKSRCLIEAFSLHLKHLLLFLPTTMYEGSISLVLMTECNSEKILDNMFYEADVAYIGARSKEPGHQGCGTEQQPFFIALSTSRNSNYPQFIK